MILKGTPMILVSFFFSHWALFAEKIFWKNYHVILDPSPLRVPFKKNFLITSAIYHVKKFVKNPFKIRILKRRHLVGIRVIFFAIIRLIFHVKAKKQFIQGESLLYFFCATRDLLLFVAWGDFKMKHRILKNLSNSVYRKKPEFGVFFIFFDPKIFSKILKMTHIGVMLCGKSIARIPEAWKCFFPDPDSGK